MYSCGETRFAYAWPTALQRVFHPSVRRSQSLRPHNGLATWRVSGPVVRIQQFTDPRAEMRTEASPVSCDCSDLCFGADLKISQGMPCNARNTNNSGAVEASTAFVNSQMSLLPSIFVSSRTDIIRDVLRHVRLLGRECASERCQRAAKSFAASFGPGMR